MDAELLVLPVDDRRRVSRAGLERLTGADLEGVFAVVGSAGTTNLGVVDPHTWLFAPFDCCALLYRDPRDAIHAHRQDAGYLETLNDREEPNPADLAIHLTRRARGLPFWFSLAVHGTAACTDAVEAVLTLTREVTAIIDGDPVLETVHRPELSVIVFRRLGWAAEDYLSWERRLLERSAAFVAATRHDGRTVARLCIINPLTTLDDLRDHP